MAVLHRVLRGPRHKLRQRSNASSEGQVEGRCLWQGNSWELARKSERCGSQTLGSFFNGCIELSGCGDVWDELVVRRKHISCLLVGDLTKLRSLMMNRWLALVGNFNFAGTRSANMKIMLSLAQLQFLGMVWHIHDECHRISGDLFVVFLFCFARKR